MPISIESGIQFVNISQDQSTILSYRTEFSTKHHLVEIKSIPTNRSIKKQMFFHINKGDIKIVYKRTDNNFLFIVGANISVQFQVMEALLDYLIEIFYTDYEQVLKDFTSGSGQIFQDFKNKIEYAVKNFHNLNLITYVQVFCNICKKSHIVAVKNSLIQNSKKSIVPLVYNHNGIPILIYIDKDYGIRGVEDVSISG